MTTILLASRNAKKLKELRRVVAAAGITGLDVVGLDDVPEFAELPEDGATFEDNALIKARTGAAATGLPTLADDSGISVDALNGMPGVLSARWSGTHGNDEARQHPAARPALGRARRPPRRRLRVGVRAGPSRRHRNGGPRRDGAAPWPANPTASTASATTRCSCPPTTSPPAAPQRNCHRKKDSLSHRGKALAALVPDLRALATGQPA